LCIVLEDNVSALSGSVSLLEEHVVHLEQLLPATTMAGAGPPQKKRMNGGRRTGCGHGGGGHLSMSSYHSMSFTSRRVPSVPMAQPDIVGIEFL
jgi:hypothetical protein